MTRLVKQQGEYDCFLACLAMAITNGETQPDKLFHEALLKSVEENKGCYGSLMEEAFNQVLHPICTWYKTNVSHLRGLPCRIGKNILFDLIRGRRVILQVPSLNHENMSHMVYWDGYKLFDPSNLKTYTELDQLDTEWVYTFRESDCERSLVKQTR